MASGLDADSRYALPMAPYWSSALREQFWLSPEDILIIETDRHYLDRLDVVANRLGVVRLSVDNGDLLTLARILVEWGNLYTNVFIGDKLPPAITKDMDNFSQLPNLHRASIIPSRKKTQDDDDGGESAEDKSSPTRRTERQSAHRTAASAKSRGPGEQEGVAVPRSVTKRIRLIGCENIVGVAHPPLSRRLFPYGRTRSPKKSPTTFFGDSWRCWRSRPNE